jgi:hypothetical protein
MKTSKSLLVGVFLSATLGSGLGSAHANDVSLKSAPVEFFYCRERLPTFDQDTESWIPAAPSPDDTFIDVDERCNDDPPGVEEARRLRQVTLGGYF